MNKKSKAEKYLKNGELIRSFVYMMILAIIAR